METIKGTITGMENIKDQTDPYSALVEFYKAFNNGNLKLMQQNWLQTSEASMSNPLGNLFRGWEQISAVYNGSSMDQLKSMLNIITLRFIRLGTCFVLSDVREVSSDQTIMKLNWRFAQAEFINWQTIAGNNYTIMDRSMILPCSLIIN